MIALEHSRIVGRQMLNRMTAALLKGFVAENSLEDLKESKQFEHFAAFSMIRRHFSRQFSTHDVVMGGGGDTGIDSIAIIVNNVLVTDVDAVHELAEQNGYVEPTFIFIQSSTSASFDGKKIGTLGFGVVDFFSKTPALPRSPEVQEAAAISDAIIDHHAAILRSPKCFLYYVTTGLWQDDVNLVARKDGVVSDIGGLAIFDKPEMLCVGAADLHSAYQRTKSPVTKSFVFEQKVEIPAIDGVEQSFIGYVPFLQFKRLLMDESGSEILTSIFEDNIRDWQGYKTVNSNMRETLLSPNRDKFIIMNNGVTIITRKLTRVGNNFTISDYQIVNGCQTSNVLFEQRESIGDTVLVPLRLIQTENESIREAITTATNNQTDIKFEQFASQRKFSRELELYFTTFPEEHRLYYERRDGQYDRGAEQKVRIIDLPTVLRSYAAIFSEIPHTATKNYATIRNEIGDRYFADGHKLAPYYYAAYSWFLLEGYFRSRVIESVYKSARYHILMTVNLLIDSGGKLQPNSNEIEKRAEAALTVLFDANKALATFQWAVSIIDAVTNGDLARDNVRTEVTTQDIIRMLRTGENTDGVG